MKRPSQHRTGEIGELEVAQRLTESGWIVTKLHADYGFDFLIQRVEGETVTSDFALVQVKAVQTPGNPSTNRGSPACRLWSRHLSLWESSPIPCFLAVVDISVRQIYLLDSKTVIKDLGYQGKDDQPHERSYTVYLPVSSLLDLAQLKKASDAVARYWSEVRKVMLVANGFKVGDVSAIAFLPLMWNSFLGAILGFKHKPRDLLAMNSRLRPLVGDQHADRITRDLRCSIRNDG
jgi:hypothetical protein